MKSYCFLDGKILRLDEAKIPATDISLMRGFGLYEALAVIKGKTLHFHDHWERLLRGAETLGIKIPISEEEAERKTIEIVEKSDLSERVNIRIILTGGEVVSGIDFIPEKARFVIMAEEWGSLPKELYEAGGKLIVDEYLREMPEIKTTNYLRAVYLQKLKKYEDAVEILYTHNGEALECATSNIFLVKNGVLITPDKDILEGVTRKIILELAKEVYKIEKRKVLVEELKSASEVFITASFKDIVPIVKIGDLSLGNGIVGPITKDLMRRFAKYIS